MATPLGTPVNVRRRFLAVTCASLAAIFALGVIGPHLGNAQAFSVSLKAAKKKVKLGNGVRLTVKVRGISNPGSATFRVEKAKFPYTSWKRSRSAAPLPAARFSLTVKPRVNTKYRVSVKRGKSRVTSRKKPLIYVRSLFSESGEFGPGVFTLREEVILDASYGRKWGRVPKRDRFIYVFQACGTDTKPTTKYRRLAKLRLKVQVSGNTTLLSGGGTMKTNNCGSQPTRWIGSWFNATVNKVLRNGDNGYGPPDLSRKNLERRDRLKLKKVLTLKQARVLFG